MDPARSWRGLASGAQGRAWVLFAALGFLACAEKNVNRSSSAVLEGSVARVGATDLTGPLVASVAVAKRVSTRRALEALAEDALLAEEAQLRGLDEDPEVRRATRAAFAKRLLADLDEEARRGGPPSEEELAARTVVQAIVVRSDELTLDRAFALASAIHDAVSGARSTEDFEQRARAVPQVGAKVIVNRVGPFGPRDEALEANAHESALPRPFVAAALALHDPGQTSPVVETQYGWHVIRLTDLAPPPPSAMADHPQDLAVDVLRLRVEAAAQGLLLRLRQRVTVQVVTGADAIMTRVAAEAPGAEGAGSP